jgi:hypothetical protein
MNDLLEQVHAGLKEAGSAVQAARTLLNQGNQVDLSGLEKYVEDLCGSVARLPDGKGGALKPALIKLIDQLGELSEDITAERDKLASEMKTLSDRRRAASAYESGTGSPGKPPRK